MRAIFNLEKTGIFWWGLITASVFMIPEFWINGIATSMRNIDTTPFRLIIDFGNEIDNATLAVLRLIRFERNQALLFIGPYGIANVFVGIVFGILFFVIAVVFYFRAARSHAILNDLLAMVFLYIVMRVIGVASKNLNIGVIDYVHSREPNSYLVILSIFIIILLFRGQGLNDSRVFFKALFEGLVVWIVVQPRVTLDFLAWMIERPAALNRVLTENPVINRFYPMVVAFWALIGLIIVAINLYGAGKLAAPAASGGGGEAKKPG